MNSILLSREEQLVEGHLALPSSKSISNRVLIIRALCGQDFDIKRLANARDTEILDHFLQTKEAVYDVGAAGTSFRFLTAYLSMQPGSQVLTGSARMKQRPIGVLVEALRKMGANIEYLEKEGYPPLHIHEAKDFGQKHELSIPAHTSSQYITALLLLAPCLPNGLQLKLEGEIVSRPYIEMSLQLMAFFGIQYQWEGQHIHIKPQPYQARPFTVEADWSAAGYYYSLAALSESCSLQLDGLFEDSLQGDAVLQDIYTAFGIKTTFNKNGLRIDKAKNTPLPPVFEYDFLKCPDIAQTLAVSCAAMGINGLFSGLETLKIKETDRIAALQAECKKVGVYFTALPRKFSKNSTKNYFMLEGKARWESPPTFKTYEDHRMAMAFAPLGLLGAIRILEPDVVKKSYPDFWKDLEKIGFSIGA